MTHPHGNNSSPHSLVLQGEAADLGLQRPHKHQQKLLVHDEVSEGDQLAADGLAVDPVGQREGLQDGVGVVGAGEEEAHGEGAEVAIGEVLVGGRDLDQVGQVGLELGEGWR